MTNHQRDCAECSELFWVHDSQAKNFMAFCSVDCEKEYHEEYEGAAVTEEASGE